MVKKFMYKDNYFMIKLGASILLVGLGFRLLHNRFVAESPLLENTHNSAPSLVPVDSQENADEAPLKGQIFIHFSSVFLSIFGRNEMP